MTTVEDPFEDEIVAELATRCLWIVQLQPGTDLEAAMAAAVATQGDRIPPLSAAWTTDTEGLPPGVVRGESQLWLIEAALEGYGVALAQGLTIPEPQPTKSTGSTKTCVSGRTPTS